MGSRREMLYQAIEASGTVASSTDLIGVAGITDRAELHNFLYSLQKRGKIEFRESHAKHGVDNLTKIRLRKRKDQQVNTESATVEAPIEVNEAPVEAVVPADEAPPATNGTKTDQILDWIRAQSADPKGWVMASSGEIAGYTGIEPGFASAHLNNLEKRNAIEVLRVSEGKRKRIIGVRMIEAAQAERAEKVSAFKRALYRELPHTPLIDQYVEAKELAETNPWLKLEPEPIYEEGLRLKRDLTNLINELNEGAQ